MNRFLAVKCRDHVAEPQAGVGVQKAENPSLHSIQLIHSFILNSE
jgi:hypothetical protein